jgi:hypothetical protein
MATLMVIAGAAACDPTLALAPRSASIEIAILGVPEDGAASVLAFIEDTHPPYNRSEQEIPVGSSVLFEDLGVGFDIRFGIRNLGQHRCAILDGSLNGVLVADSTGTVETRNETTENAAFTVRCRSASIDVVVNGLPAGDSARVVLATPYDTIIDARFRNGSRTVAVVPGPAVNILPDLVSGSDGFAYDAAPVTVNAYTAQTTTATLDFRTSIENQAGFTLSISGLPSDSALVFRAFTRSLAPPFDEDSVDIAMNGRHAFTNRPVGVQYEATLTGLAAHRCRVRVDGEWTFIGDATSTTVTTRRNPLPETANFNLSCRTAALDVVVAGLPPGDSAHIAFDGIFSDDRLHVPNGTHRLYFVPYLVRIDPQPVSGADGLAYEAPRDSVFTFSRQTTSVTVPYATQQPGSISGAVTGNGFGIGGATVTLSGAASAVATSGTGGVYAFNALPPGTYTLTVSSPFPGVTFPSPSQTVTLAGGQSLIVNFSGTYGS